MDFQAIRRPSRTVCVGTRTIGGASPIVIQSMTNQDPHDATATAAQILQLQEAGCEIVRITIPDMEAAENIPAIKRMGVKIPLVADIHFDHRIAVRCAELGIDKIRINPGNIGSDEHVKRVVDACRAREIPIRIGVNSGSLEKSILQKHGAPTSQALCESARHHCELLERLDFDNIVVSIKASDVKTMVDANRLLAQSCPYPIHLGVTEAGGGRMAVTKSAIGIGSLLCDGIGDTVRVSLTDNPVEEIQAAQDILDALHVSGQCGMDIVSCPTCGRTKIDLIALSREFQTRVMQEKLDRFPIKVALMGCVVNGPGEAREADVGIAGGRGEGLLFRHGEIVEKLPETDLIPRLIQEIRHIANEKGYIC